MNSVPDFQARGAGHVRRSTARDEGWGAGPLG
jgi:hypothetical protein